MIKNLKPIKRFMLLYNHIQVVVEQQFTNIERPVKTILPFPHFLNPCRDAILCRGSGKASQSTFLRRKL